MSSSSQAGEYLGTPHWFCIFFFFFAGSAAKGLLTSLEWEVYSLKDP